MPVNKDDISPCIESVGDKVHRLVRTILGGSPIAGGALVELFSTLVTPPLEKRREKWMADVTESILALEATRKVDIVNLFEQDEFISSLLEASSYAIKTHKAENLLALKNAVVNSVLPGAPDEFYQSKFLQWTSELTPQHLVVLQFWSDPSSFGQNNNVDFSVLFKPNNTSSNRYEIMSVAIPSFTGKEPILEIIMQDLYSKDLTGSSGGGQVISESNKTPRKCTTELGDSFVKFISEYEI